MQAEGTIPPGIGRGQHNRMVSIEKLSQNPTFFNQKNWESLAISGQDGIISTVSNYRKEFLGGM